MIAHAGTPPFQFYVMPKNLDRDMYVGDPRFAKNYGGLEGAEFVRDAFDFYAGHSL